MSIKRHIERNIARQDRKELEKYNAFLKPELRSIANRDANLMVNLARNGITPNDVKKEIEVTKRRVYENTVTAVMKVTYAAVAVVLAEEFNFSKDECFKAMSAIDHRMAVTIDDEEIIKEMEEKAGIRFNHKNGVERIERI